MATEVKVVQKALEILKKELSTEEYIEFLRDLTKDLAPEEVLREVRKREGASEVPSLTPPTPGQCILLSIKPKYVEEIIAGNKKFEFRKSIWKRNGFKRVYVYSSSPVKKIVGAFTLGDIIEDHPQNLWDKLGQSAGINEDEFFNYFDTHETGFAIGIEEFNTFKNPIDPFQKFPDFKPPQSYYYVDENMFAL